MNFSDRKTMINFAYLGIAIILFAAIADYCTTYYVAITYPGMFSWAEGNTAIRYILLEDNHIHYLAYVVGAITIVLIPMLALIKFTRRKEPLKDYEIFLTYVIIFIYIGIGLAWMKWPIVWSMVLFGMV